MFKKTLTIVALLASASLVSAATTVTNTFSSGQTIVASQMNTNFSDLASAKRIGEKQPPIFGVGLCRRGHLIGADQGPPTD